MQKPETFIVSTAFGLVALYMTLSYLHAILDPSVTFETIGYTLSAVSDSPERQLLALLIITVVTFVIASAVYTSNKNYTHPVICSLLLLMAMFLFATLIVRTSTNPMTHNMLAASTLFMILLAMLAMAAEIQRTAVQYSYKFAAASAATSIVFMYAFALLARVIDLRWARNMQMLATLEATSLIGFIVLLIMFLSL